MIDERTDDGREIADLLPWYATDRLDGRTRDRVSAALATDPALRQELTLIIEEKDATIDLNEALGAPSRAAVDRFFATLDAQAATKRQPFRLTAWLERLQPRTVGWAALAAVLLVVAQGTVIGTLMSARPTTYAVSSVKSESGIASGAVLLVSFQPEATAGALQKLLEDTDASIVEGPLPGGLYRLRVGDRALGPAAMDELVTRLKARNDVVRFAAPGGAAD